MAATATLVSKVPPKSKTPAMAVWWMTDNGDAATVKRGPLRQKLYVLSIEFCKGHRHNDSPHLWGAQALVAATQIPFGCESEG